MVANLPTAPRKKSPRKRRLTGNSKRLMLSPVFIILLLCFLRLPLIESFLPQNQQSIHPTAHSLHQKNIPCDIAVARSLRELLFSTSSNIVDDDDKSISYSVGICGAGAIALGTAALLTQAGHDPMLWSPSGKIHKNLDGDPDAVLTVSASFPAADNNHDEFVFHPRIANSCHELLQQNEIIFVALPANGHKAILDQLVPLLDPQRHKAVIISSHSSLGALYLSNALYLHQQEKYKQSASKPTTRIPIYAWGTTVCTARRDTTTTNSDDQHADRHRVRLNTIRKQVDWCTVPATTINNVDSNSTPLKQEELLQTLFPQIVKFPHRQNILAISLSNLNPQNHLGIALGNMSRMEKHEQWYQLLHVTPNIGRYLEALDQERLRICQALGVTTKTIFEHFRDGFGVPETDKISQMNQEIYKQGKDVYGPDSADSRYVLEDVPFGLTLTVQLGEMVGQPALLHEAGLRTMSAMYGIDFAKENDLLNALQINQYTLDELQEAAVTGILPSSSTLSSERDHSRDEAHHSKKDSQFSWDNERPERTMVG